MADFDPDKYLTEKTGRPFDPDAYLAAKTGAKPSKPKVEREGPGIAERAMEGRTGAVIRGFGQGASMGFGDEMAGTVGALDEFKARHPILGPAAARLAGLAFPPLGLLNAADDVSRLGAFSSGMDDADQALAPSKTASDRDALVQAYRGTRNQERAANDAAHEAHPYIGGTAELAGGLMVPMPGPGAKVGAGALTKMGSRALSGVLTGGLLGAGNSTADLTGDPTASAGLGSFAGDVASSAAFGGVASPVIGSLIDRGGLALSQALRKMRDSNALKAAGLKAGIGNRLQSMGIGTEGDALQLGSDIYDSGLVRPLSTPGSVHASVGDQRPIYSALVGDALDQTQKTGVPFNQQPVANEVSRRLFGAESDATAVREGGKAKMLLQDLADQEQRAPGDWQGFQNQKRSMQAGINYKADASLPVEQQRMVASELRKGLETQMRAAAGDDVADQYVNSNKKLSLLHDIEGLASNEETRALARGGPLSKGSLMAAGTLASMGGASGGIPGAIGGAVLPAVAGFVADRAPSTMMHLQGLASPLARSLSGPLAKGATLAGQQQASKRGVPPKPSDQADEEAVRAFLDQ